MADTTYRGRVLALIDAEPSVALVLQRAHHTPEENSPARRAPDPHGMRLDAFRQASRIAGPMMMARTLAAAEIAEEADAEIGEANAAIDPEIDRGLPLHGRIAILRMQRDSFADFAEEVAKVVGMEGEDFNNVLDAVKSDVSARDAGERLHEVLAATIREKSNALVKAIADVDALRERLAIAEAELDNLRGVPGAWAKTADERDREHEKAERTNRARAVLAHWLALLTGVEERQIAAAAWEAKEVAGRVPDFMRQSPRGDADFLRAATIAVGMKDASAIDVVRSIEDMANKIHDLSGSSVGGDE